MARSFAVLCVADVAVQNVPDARALGIRLTWTPGPNNAINDVDSVAVGHATIIEDHVSLGPGESFTNAVTEIAVGADANVEWIKLQREDPSALHVSEMRARVARDGRFRAETLSFGTALTRNDARVELTGPGAAASLRDRQRIHLDIQLIVASARADVVGIQDGQRRRVDLPGSQAVGVDDVAAGFYQSLESRRTRAVEVHQDLLGPVVNLEVELALADRLLAMDDLALAAEIAASAEAYAG